MEPINEMKAAAEAARTFEASLRLWGTLSPCRASEDGGVLLLSTGTAIPDQNYALRIREGDIAAMTAASRAFFSSERMPFTWWIPPGPEAGAESLQISGAGLSLRCAPAAMHFSLPEKAEILSLSGADMQPCRSPAEAAVWAAASLEGFGSGREHLESFAAFASSMTTIPAGERFRLLTLHFGGQPAATSMLTFPGETAGLFYFSVIPRFRGRGLGGILLQKTLEEARRTGCSAVVLQASPMGLPLYRKWGFSECGRFLVHSSDPDAC